MCGGGGGGGTNAPSPTPQAATPIFSVAGGTYSSDQSVTISCTTSGANIYYTTNGSTPTSSSTRYAGAIPVTSSTTLKAVASASGYTDSAVATATYTLKVAAPAITPAAGTYTGTQTATINTTTSGASIHYTTDGSTPTASSTTYTAPITVSSSLTLKAIATKTGYSDSDLTSNSYTISAGAPNYTFKNVKILAGGYIPGVYFHPTQQNLMYARTDIGGIYRWGPNDTQWVPLLDWLSDGFFNGGDAIGLDPTDPNMLYVAVGLYDADWAANGAMLISRDQGETFKTVPLGFRNGSNSPARGMGERIAVDPNLHTTVYFGTRQNGLQISTNSGDNWAQMTGLTVVSSVPTGGGNTMSTGVVSVLPVKSSGSSGSATPVVYAAVGGTGLNGNSQGLYVTTNGGSKTSTWTAVAGQPSFAAAPKPMAPMQAKLGPDNSIYIVYGDAAGPDSVSVGQLWKFVPGASWTSGTWTQIALPANVNGPADQQGYGSVAVDPSHAGHIMVGTLDQYWPTGDVIYRSTDDGATWRDVSSVNTGGYSRSPNLATHENLNAPYVGAPGTVSTGNWNTGLAIDPFDPDHAMYTFGGGLWITHNLTHADPSATSRGIVDWKFEDEGIEETAVNVLLAPPSGNTILLSGIGDVSGFAHTDLTASPAQGKFTNPSAMPSSMDFVQNTPTTVVRVSDGTYGASPLGVISTDGGMNWTGFAAMPTGTTKGGGSIAIAADGSSMVWATMDTSSVWYSNNGGATWTASRGIAAQSQVVSDRAKAGVYYGYNGSTGTLTRSTDGGVTFTTIQTGLPLAAAWMAAPTLYSLPDAQGNLWLTAGGNANGLYTNTGTAASLQLTTVAGVQKSTYLGYGKAAPASSKLTIFLVGTIGAQWGLYRSTDGGTSWIRINDDAHQYGGIGPVAGDMRTFGTVYFAGSGRGILWGTSAN